jgi:hypothetical protein
VAFADRRASKKSLAPSAIACGLPDARFDGSRSTGCGHGPWLTMRRISCDSNATSPFAPAPSGASAAAKINAAFIPG